MRVLVLGATGFIGAEVLAALHAAGHAVLAGARDAEGARLRFPFAEAMAVDLQAPVDWASLLQGVDAVVNCMGLLQAPAAVLEAVHHEGPARLFAACGSRRVIHISAVSAVPEAGTDYALSKWRGDEALKRSGADWVLLRPSLVWSPAGSYGGTSAIRGLAALPWIVPLVGAGAQAFTPITVEDLGRAVVRCLDLPGGTVLEPCGPEDLTLKQMLHKLRRWLGLPQARFVCIPLPAVAALCRIGDVLGAGPLRTTALKQAERGNRADPGAFIGAIGFGPQSMDEALGRHPAQEQDRLHARAFFAEPALRLVLAVIWLVSGIAGLLAPAGFIEQFGLPVILGRLASLFDLGLAAAVLSGWRPVLVGQVQLALVLGYTAFLSVAAPSMWLEPFGSLLKNLAVLALIPVHMALGAKR